MEVGNARENWMWNETVVLLRRSTMFIALGIRERWRSVGARCAEGDTHFAPSRGVAQKVARWFA